MADLKSMTRDRHYAEIEAWLKDAVDKQTLNPGRAAVSAAVAQVHAQLLVEKALLERST